MSFTTYCVCPELRPLPSTSVTRLQRYYEPLRHPRAPGLSLTGFRLVLADHALGLPVLRTLSLCTCCRHYPGTATGGLASLIPPQSYQPSLIWPSGRPVHCPFRGLLSVHSRYGLHTRAVTVYRDPLSEGFSHFVTSIAAPVASGWSVSPGGACTHWKAPPFHGARQLQTHALQQNCTLTSSLPVQSSGGGIMSPDRPFSRSRIPRP